MKTQIFKYVIAAIALTCGVMPSMAAESQFGPTQKLNGVFFSNFENAKLFVCKPDDQACTKWVEGEAYNLVCEGGKCVPLFDAVKKSASGPNDTAYIKVILTGQTSLEKVRPTFLGDPGQSIYVEHIESVESLKGGLAYQLPVLAIEAQGSAGASAPFFCSSSTEMPSGDRTNAIWPSRGGRLIITPISAKR